MSASDQAPATSTRGRGLHLALKVGRNLLVVVVLAAAIYSLVRNWQDVDLTIHQLTWTDWVPSLIVVLAAIACSTLSWQVMVDELGEPIGALRGGQVFLVGQLGKYLPGSVWAYVLQLELGRRAGLARTRVFAGTVFSLAIAVVAALIAGSLAIPTLVSQNPSLAPIQWCYVLLPIGLICLHPKVLTWAARTGFRLLRRPDPGHPVGLKAVAKSFGWALASYGFFGLHLWLLVHNFPNVGLGLLPLSIGTMAAGMLAGLFFFLLPSGAGVRELVIVTALSPSVGSGKAVAFAAVSRVFLTVADLVSAGAAALAATIERRRYGSYHGDPGVDDDEA